MDIDFTGAAPENGASLRNIALVLKYRGTAYHGWQKQKNQPTVCEAIERAIASVLCHEVKLTGCGRTDSGVHAEKYVANFRTGSGIPTERMPLAFNSRLPDDISVCSAHAVSRGFNAIGSCLRKEYTYRIHNARTRDPFLSERAHFYPMEIDLEKIEPEARKFVGRRDFKAMQTSGSDVKTTVRTVHYFKVAREGSMISFSVCADGFLYNMVRAMAGTLLYVSEGKIDDVAAVLDSGDRTLAGPTAPACGLYMTGVWFDEELL